ncbi:homeobox protein knotted-1, putative [Entamoeba invadens IP1]|uniref:homeobox protein knotted-1, putative n=1 Tax=Entamoeba invadens IP1 TaxID=370355 RepID=UPI0002C3FBF8|nr:homeobox protein knotted-1, putative [Entamoeba invadens IP1]ELP93118.1 homeobox protein knotted-1, putative [Entamoeba invadens IP1]|eukprot:XP_004259889.1 homeobox protein knotted-1, putative [Entamoeba invadens IP1]
MEPTQEVQKVLTECVNKTIDFDQYLKCFEQSLVRPSGDISDQSLMEKVQHVADLVTGEKLLRLNELVQIFNSQAEVLYLYYTSYYTQLVSLLDSQSQKRIVTQDERSYKISCLRALFGNIYSHLKLMFGSNVSSLAPRERKIPTFLSPQISVHSITSQSQPLSKITCKNSLVLSSTKPTKPIFKIDKIKTQSPKTQKIKPLLDWFVLHSNHPYPTEEQKERLGSECGMSPKQVGTWFSNKRNRNKNQN